jgi:hypothetical protein
MSGQKSDEPASEADSGYRRPPLGIRLVLIGNTHPAVYSAVLSAA